MRRRLTSILAIATVTVAGSLAGTGAARAAESSRAATTDARVAAVTTATTFTQKVPVNVVLIGYTPQQVSTDQVRAQLPANYRPIVRYPAFYGLKGRDLGLNYEFDYSFRTADRRLTDEFFAYARSIGTTGPLTAFQQAYNDQKTNVRDVSSQVLYIDAPKTERWLHSRARNLGVDPVRGYTVFLINWASRPDFQFHVYTKTDVADPDTGYNFGERRGSRKMIAWGGSSGRSWFYDLSAGPDAFSNNYIVDTPDVDGDGAKDYIVPPVWEYTAGGYRAPGELSADLGRVIRYAAINLLFTSSPLYDPLRTAPQPGGAKVVDVSMFEDDADPSVSGTQFLSRSFVLDTLKSFQPYYNWKVGVTPYDPIDGKAERSLRIWAGLTEQDDCWNTYGSIFAQLFCYFDANRSAYGKNYSKRDYVGSVYAFNTTSANQGGNGGLLGYADDDWRSGKQSYIFAFDNADTRSLGYGFSTTTAHEFGHHIGMSHPHDGYDATTGVDYGNAGAFTFVGVGDESETLMSYMDLSDRFGQFDQDNMYRWETAGYLNEAALLIGKLQEAGKDGGKAAGAIAKATVKRAQSLAAFQRWDYLRAASAAYEGWEAVAAVAQQAGISTEIGSGAKGGSARTAPRAADHKNEPRPFLTD